MSDENRANNYSTFPPGQSADVQPEEPALPEQNQDQDEPVNVQGTFSSIMMFLMRQSYVAALVVMMVRYFCSSSPAGYPGDFFGNAHRGTR